MNPISAAWTAGIPAVTPLGDASAPLAAFAVAATLVTLAAWCGLAGKALRDHWMRR